MPTPHIRPPIFVAELQLSSAAKRTGCRNTGRLPTSRRFACHSWALSIASTSQLRLRCCSTRRFGSVAEKLFEGCHLAVDFVHDLVFDLLRPNRRLAVIDHCAAALITAFGQDAARRDVSHDVVAIAGHPRLKAMLLRFRANREIDDNFSA